jgi:hypothetical protein
MDSAANRTASFPDRSPSTARTIELLGLRRIVGPFLTAAISQIHGTRDSMEYGIRFVNHPLCKNAKMVNSASHESLESCKESLESCKDEEKTIRDAEN